ncbi:inositol polyphosphate-4-phosphatase type I A [Pelomyxa schiedti]|nr:inositol polyphosphate-4-phosphatase type I A [Pelomyxa schiedti]
MFTPKSRRILTVLLWISGIVPALYVIILAIVFAASPDNDATEGWPIHYVHEYKVLVNINKGNTLYESSICIIMFISPSLMLHIMRHPDRYKNNRSSFWSQEDVLNSSGSDLETGSQLKELLHIHNSFPQKETTVLQGTILSVRLQLSCDCGAIIALDQGAVSLATASKHELDTDNTEYQPVTANAPVEFCRTFLVLFPTFTITVKVAHPGSEQNEFSALCEIPCTFDSIDSQINISEGETSGWIQITSGASLKFRGASGDCFKTYLYRDTSNSAVHIWEELRESVLSFSVPYQIIYGILHDRESQLKKIQDKYHHLISEQKDVVIPDEDMLTVAVYGMEQAKQTADWEAKMKVLLKNFAGHVDSCGQALAIFKQNKIDEYTFKPSSLKSDKRFQFVPINLHTHLLLVTDIGDAVYPTVTFGAAAAHTCGMSKGSGALSQRIVQLTAKTDLTQSEEIQLDALRLVLLQRRDILLCHIASALAEAASSGVEAAWRKGKDACSDYLSLLCSCGLLVAFESLLSTRGREASMLSDFDCAVNMLEGFLVRLTLSPKEVENGVAREAVSIRQAHGHWILELPCNKTLLDLAPSSLDAFPVHGCLFTQGINEEQSMANTMGDTQLQETINLSSLDKLRSHFEQYCKWVTEISGKDVKKLEILQEDFQRLSHRIHNVDKGGKDVIMLTGVADFCRSIGGVRCTSCKSAKDRTSMGVTWENVRILTRYHGLPPDKAQSMMDAMREAGVRRVNVKKNIGEDKFAFNALQARLLPEQYRPPRSTQAGFVGVKS